MRLGVSLKAIFATRDLVKRISWLARSDRLLNVPLPGVDLAGVFLGRAEATFSASLSDGDGDRAV